ncbi:MAG: redoxin domain-containing protein [Gammaproteobacteria bacterium]|nr:redoxin domain-containing protein [Gammaproteobacteria bacterium]MDE0453262.1 redoxin domain-containing protein [Gammaproteobacteria bacterium]
MCKAQFVELNAWQDRFEGLGVNVVGMTYDAPEVLSDFVLDKDLGYALLSDPDGAYVTALGIRNDEYGPGHPGFGIPHPGIMLVDPSRAILYKAAMEDYRKRPSFESVFDAVSGAVQ